ncbi:RNA polymerase sigma factor [Olleya aquimaris]|uniref:RNA polymerase sigma factor n=1 Tax=Olleya sediminilitoris TaxID=2795739 RepID=A0ABS1WJ04_9FLAO|nr:MULTISPECIES: RNA polymerase sigma factor [Olleya]AXO81188.1 RNA polymerase sigma factor [Olleya aquimaris]MBL7559109.1 RNA polymerase sigma factor [Olleya sediminilitoris]
MELEQLIKSCKRNNLKAQGDLYQRYKDTLYLQCLKYSKNKEEAQDNLHDSFIEIFKSIKKYKNKGSFEGWMKRITINLAINKYKKEGPLNIIINNDILEDTTVTDEELNLELTNILNCIQELPNQYRLVFNLYQLDGYSHKEVAKLLGISVNTSKSNLHRAKVLLKEKIIKLNQTKPRLYYGS